jgi:hypothetical protein
MTRVIVAQQWEPIVIDNPVVILVIIIPIAIAIFVVTVIPWPCLRWSGHPLPLKSQIRSSRPQDRECPRGATPLPGTAPPGANPR